MALDFMCGFEGMANAQISQGVFTSNAAGTVSSSGARTGSRCLTLSSSGSNVLKSGLSNAATRVAGFGYKLSSISAGGRVFFAFGDGDPATAGNSQVGIQYNTDGSFAAYRGRASGGNSGGTLLGTSATARLGASDTWYFVEVQVTFHGSTGVVLVYVNNVEILNLTGLDTTETANAYANAVSFNHNTSGGSSDFDDIYVLSGTGGTSTTRFGDFRIAGGVVSSGDGSNAQFTPSTGSDNGAMVDDATPNSDTDYNESSTVGFIDTYNLAALGVSGNVKGVQVKNYQKASSGSVGMRPVIRIGSTNYFGTAQSVPSSYAYGPLEIFELSPATAAAFTVSEIDGAEFGVEHNS